MNITFLHPIPAIIMFLLFLGVFLHGKTSKFFGYSHIRFFSWKSSLFHKIFSCLPRILTILIVAGICLAFSQPQIKKEHRYKVIETRDILLCVDLSYSMENNPYGYNDKGVYLEGRSVTTKLEYAKYVINKFVDKRREDRIGLIVFGDDPFGIWPFSQDRMMIKEKVLQLGDIYSWLGGTDIAKALYTCINYISQASKVEQPILIIVTDGIATIEAADVVYINFLLKKYNIKLFCVQVFPEARLISEELNEIVKSSDGEVFPAEDPERFEKIFAEIDNITKNEVEIELVGEISDIYPYICLIVIFLILGFITMRGFRL